MAKRFLNLAIALTAAFILLGGAFAPEGFAGEKLQVSGIKAIYVEKGAQNYLVSVRALVTNQGASDDFTIEAVAVDKEGFQLQTVKFSGHIKGGETKSLLEQVRMPKTVYNQIAAWELKEG